MDRREFLAEFGHIARTPRGIDQLRQVIYQLAITGALTEQNDADGAGDLLAEVQDKRRALIAAQRYKRLLKLESERIRIPDEIKIPRNWCWTRLLDLGEIAPRNDAAADAPAAFLPMSGVPQMHRGRIATETATWDAIRKSYTHFAQGDVVVAKITPCFENGKAAAIAELPDGLTFGAGTTELHVFRPIHPGILPDYVYLFLRSPYFALEGRMKMTGSAGQKRLPTDYFATRAFPLPPVEEQFRIVARVDQLMTLCDRLEAQQADRRALQTQLRTATLDSVGAADPQDLRETWRRLFETFERLFRAGEDVARLRTMILRLAVKGLLSEQDTADGPADVEVAETRRLAAAMRNPSARKKSTAYRPVDPDELPLPLPPGWEAVRLGELCRVINGRAYSKPELLDKGTPVLRVGNLFTSHKWYYSDLELEDDKYCHEGDLLYAWSASFGPFLWNGPRAIFHYHIWKLDLFSREALDRDFLYFVLLERTATIKAAGHGISMAHMTKANMEQLPIAVPPRREQGRIVSKIQQLMQLCDSLEDRLGSAERVGADFAASAVAALTGISLKQEKDEPVKAPRTELIAPLRLGKEPDVRDPAPLAALLARQKGEMNARDLWQRFSGDIDAFYAQLKTEVVNGWIVEPEPAEMRELTPDGEVA